MKPMARLLAVLALVAAPVAAEVRVELNPAGHVSGIHVETDLETGTVWGRLSAVPDHLLLNPLGDLSHDRMPTCGVLALPTQDAMKKPPRRRFGAQDDPRMLRSAIVAWPQFDGTDWEIVYSIWDWRTSAWRTTAFVEVGNNEFDDYDPRLVIRGKRVLLVWRRSSGPDAFALSAGLLVPVGDYLELQWDAPVELTSPPEMGTDEFINQALPQILDSGIGSSPLSTPATP